MNFESMYVYPTTNGGMQNGSSVGIHYTLLACFCTFFCMLTRLLLKKLLHRSSVGSLLRVRCWLGSDFIPGRPMQIGMHQHCDSHRYCELSAAVARLTSIAKLEKSKQLGNFKKRDCFAQRKESASESKARLERKEYVAPG